MTSRNSTWGPSSGRQPGRYDGQRVSPRRSRKEAARDGTISGLPPVRGQRSGFYAANLPGSSRAHAETERERAGRRALIASMAASIGVPLRANATTAEVNAYKQQLRRDVLGSSDASKRAARKRVAETRKRYLA